MNKFTLTTLKPFKEVKNTTNDKTSLQNFETYLARKTVLICLKLITYL